MTFCDTHIPPLNSEIPILVGTTVLLPEFLSLCAVSEQRTLFFTAPFYDTMFLQRVASNFDLPSIRLEVVVKSEAIAKLLLQDLRHHHCVNFALYLCEKLHAKVYVFESLRGDLTALIGSHNPTVSGMTSNIEVGVVLRANPAMANWSTLHELKTFLIGAALPYRTNQDHSDVTKRS